MHSHPDQFENMQQIDAIKQNGKLRSKKYANAIEMRVVWMFFSWNFNCFYLWCYFCHLHWMKFIVVMCAWNTFSTNIFDQHLFDLQSLCLSALFFWSINQLTVLCDYINKKDIKIHNRLSKRQFCVCIHVLS